MDSIWANLSTGMRRFLVAAGSLVVIAAIGLQFHVSSQGDLSNTYPKGFRGGTCTIESESVVVGYSGYFIPGDYAIPENATSAMSVPVLCGKIPGPGTLDVTIDLLYPESTREWPLAMTLAKMDGGAPSKTLLAVPPKTYESGIITQVLSIGETGEYRLYLSGKDEKQADFTLEIPITVGTQWYEGIAQLWPMLLLILGAVFFHILRKL
ncbi:hypothetical protein [Nitrosovibrio sp. Nv6]|uniref:hypothetical protein n=1 Tax=Nitrosovibrio sp. Nv6 TaxID=1855340 RepID=UPI0008C1A5F7|nr:hypothetical protein [Nitrosovibrio sp. Nv6]SEO58420.1 hypothetical protein SAMN05216316_0545 [Nitrosovibrio sp. Nv6]